MESLVSTEWLQAALGEPDLRVIDATIFLPNAGREARSEYETEHIPGAVFMDLDEIVDPASPLPHMLPPAEKLASRMQSLGLGDGDRFVLYDNSPLHSAARAWWMLRSFGARQVAILDGGLAKWKAEARPTEGGTSGVRRAHFTPRLNEEAVAHLDHVRGILEKGSHEIVDARPASRFAGEDAEPRPGVSPGHIPGSRNVPQGNLFNADNSWKRGEELRRAFEEAGVDLSKPMVTTCGSGVTAAAPLFRPRLPGKEDVELYDGSWPEGGSDPSPPKGVGAA